MSDRPSPIPANNADSDAEPKGEAASGQKMKQGDPSFAKTDLSPVGPPAGDASRAGSSESLPAATSARPEAPANSAEGQPHGPGGTEPVPVPSSPVGKASEAPTELDLSPAPTSARGVPTVHIKRVTLVSESAEGSDTDASKNASLRKAESYVGFIIDGRYHILEVLAQGGMGVVYRGRHRVIDKAVAIKILRPELAHNREITQRFLTEAKAASAIGNEHIVDITDYGELPDGATYIVMEFLEGRALSHHVESAHHLPVEEVVRIVRQTAEGLQSAHDAGIVHRDLKPDNIFITRRKEETFVKILDFGIAKVASIQNAITRAGHIFGTPHYMSPEQARGQELDNRSDIYSTGVILYELLSGQVPFDGENPLGILTQHMYTEPRPLHTVCAEGRVDAGIEAVVSKCLLKEPWQRYGSMSELDEDLARWQRGEIPKAVAELEQLASAPPSLRKRLSQTRRRRFPWGVVVTALVGGVAAVAWAHGQPDSTLGRWLTLAQDRWAQPSPTAQSEPVDEAPSTKPPPLREVAMVLSPIDARVYRGKTDLGPMPLTVRIREGQRIVFTIKRPGYTSERIVVDGTEPAARVALTPLPGRPVRPPSSTAAARSGTTRVVTITDAGVTHSAPPPAPFEERDAGMTPERGAAIEHDLDAGAPATGQRERGPRTAPAPAPKPQPKRPAPTPRPSPAPDEPTPPDAIDEDDDVTQPPPPWLGPVDSVPAPGSSERPIYESVPPSSPEL